MEDNSYTPLYKIGDKVISRDTGEIATIEKVDNRCSKRYDKSYNNPGYLEYYIRWATPQGETYAWTRHYCHEVDKFKDEWIVPLTLTGKILYGN